MSNLCALAWRFLLAATLVLNPGAGWGPVAAGVAGVDASPIAAADSPPCHEDMASGQSTEPATPAESGDHGCGCGNTACQFGACCVVGAVDLPAVHLAGAARAGAQSLANRLVLEAAAPPSGRMIRPPIA